MEELFRIVWVFRRLISGSLVFTKKFIIYKWNHLLVFSILKTFYKEEVFRRAFRHQKVPQPD